MKYLLDTSVALWSVAEEGKLNSRARALLNASSSILYLSAATVWEIAVKYALGNLPLHTEPSNFIPEMMKGMGMQPLSITHAHAIAAGQLPKHHQDPFDRMLVAQTKSEGLILLTADRMLVRYQVEHVFCGR